MTEKEKRDAGMIYDANYDRELQGEMMACKDRCFAYNQLLPSQEEEQRAMLKSMLGKTGEHVRILSPFWCDYGYHITVGENFFANHGCIILDGAPVCFGDNVFVGPNCGFYTAGHPLDARRRNEGLEYAHPITVGDDVWLGGGVQVLPGVTIGSNVVIGSGSVVTHDIPGGVVAAGNPCRVLRPMTEEDKKRTHVTS